MRRSTVGLLAAVGAAMSALAGLSNGDVFALAILSASAATAIAVHLAFPRQKSHMKRKKLKKRKSKKLKKRTSKKLKKSGSSRAADPGRVASVGSPRHARQVSMTGASAESTYEFDVAVSFAGEDRDFVEVIVSRLKDAGIRVFYDTDYQVAMWGEDLAEYLDQVYRAKARYAIMFISRFYAEKMWTRYERRSALVRALGQESVYILPVRLDSTILEGLHQTIAYLDAQLMGPDGIVSATLAKLTGAPPAP
jgi:hypothetical protein